MKHILTNSFKFWPGSFTAVSSTAVLSTLGLSNPVLSTNKYLGFKV